jgi:hypothetical protein
MAARPKVAAVVAAAERSSAVATLVKLVAIAAAVEIKIAVKKMLAAVAAAAVTDSNINRHYDTTYMPPSHKFECSQRNTKQS